MSNKDQKPKIVILGAGFGGLYTALFLGKPLRKQPKAEVTLIDKSNYLLFTALLAEVLSGKLDMWPIVRSIRQMIHKLPIEFRQSTVESIDLEKSQVHTDGGTLDYDYLVLALGGVTNYFGNDNLKKYTFPFKTLGDALRLRNHVIDVLEEAHSCEDPARRRSLLTFVQVGAGATGVEAIVEICDLLHQILPTLYPNIDFHRDVRMLLVEGLERILLTMPPDLAHRAQRQIERDGIEVQLGTFVTDAGEGWVRFADGQTIETQTLIWAAGVRANPLIEALPLEKDRTGRLMVDGYLNVPSYPNVYAVGDNAHFRAEDGQPLAPTSQVAVQQAPLLARNLLARLEGGAQQPFRYHHRGDLVCVGPTCAVANPYGVQLSGLAGWFIFKAVYLSKLPGMRNRIEAMLGWLWATLRQPNISKIDLSGLATGGGLS